MYVWELAFGAILIFVYVALLGLMWPTTETKPAVWIVFLLLRIPYAAIHILDAIYPSTPPSFAIAFCFLDLIALPMLLPGILSVGPPGVKQYHWKSYLILVAICIPPIGLITVGAGLQLDVQKFIYTGRLCWRMATGYLAGVSAVASIALILSPCFTKTGREIERQVYVSVPIAVRCAWAFVTTLKSNIYTPHFNKSGIRARHICLSIVPEILAVVAFTIATWRTRWVIRSSIYKPVRRPQGIMYSPSTIKNVWESTAHQLAKRQSVASLRYSIGPPVIPTASQVSPHRVSLSFDWQTNRPPSLSPHNPGYVSDAPPVPPLPSHTRISSEYSQDSLAITPAPGTAISSSKATPTPTPPHQSYRGSYGYFSPQQSPPIPSTARSSLQIQSRRSYSAPTHRPNRIVWTSLERDILSGTLSRLEPPYRPLPATSSASTAQRKLSLILVASCIDGLDYPLTEAEEIRVRRRLDFYLTASEGLFTRALQGWGEDVGRCFDHRKVVVGIMKGLLEPGERDKNAGWKGAIPPGRISFYAG